MKIKKKMKNRTHGYDINRPRILNEHKYNGYECLTMIMLYALSNS